MWEMEAPGDGLLHAAILDITSQIELQCKISLKTGMQSLCNAVCGVKSRIDPCILHHGRGSKSLLLLPSLRGLHGTGKAKSSVKMVTFLCFG